MTTEVTVTMSVEDAQSLARLAYAGTHVVPVWLNKRAAAPLAFLNYRIAVAQHSDETPRT